MNLKIKEVILTAEGKVTFDLFWEDAWNDELNCDAAWVFAKFKQKRSPWQHINLRKSSQSDFNYKDQTPAGFSKGIEDNNTPLGIWVPKTKTGLFIYRLESSGDLGIRKIELDWDYEKSGVQAENLKEIEVEVFAIEMVYVPEAAYFLGDPAGADGPKNCFYSYPDLGAYLVDSEEEIEVREEKGALYCNQDTDFSRDETPFTIPEEFPKGYKSFWCMKYSLSTQQYVDFLNKLSRKQQQARVKADITEDSIKNYYVMTDTQVEHKGQSIVAAKKGNGTKEAVEFYTSAPQRSCNFISWADLTAYAAWSGLRPLTELEYEKACRGEGEPVCSEFAWGTTDIGRVDSFSGAEGSGNEKKVPQRGLVNANFGCGIAPFEKAEKDKPDNPGFNGPVSGGLFANSHHQGIDKRENDGASFYRIMELSGNVWEKCITVGSELGRKYKGSHGTGELNEEGFAEIVDWPKKDARGTGVRGGVFVSPTSYYLIMTLRAFAAVGNPRKGKHGGCRLAF
ncbi:MAG: SUMF1/EgtB/PvdO family nonheme iron enzyme [Bacillota bacterium]